MIFGDSQLLTRVLQAPACGMSHSISFQGVSTDTRTLQAGSLFVALKGERFDGHAFIPQALEQGASLVISEIPVPAPHLLVKDTLQAYQTLGRWWRQQFNVPVVGITGSVGKTTTKELLAAALGLYGTVLKSQANHNNDIGVAQTVLQLDASHDFVVLEMAMRGSGEIARLAHTALPTHALITNVGTAHIGRLGSREAIAAAKCELLSAPGLEWAILNGEDDRLVTTAHQVWAGSTLTYGLTGGEFRGRWDPDSQSVQVGARQIPIPLAGRHHALNWMSVLATLHSLKLDLSRLHSDLDLGETLQGRNRQYYLPHNVELLDETYNAAPEAMTAALTALCHRSPGPISRNWAILGPMRELGSFADQLYAEVGTVAARLPLFQVLLLDPERHMQALADHLHPDQVRWFQDGTSLVTYLLHQVKPGDRLLFKAARAIALETVMQAFIDQWSQTNPEDLRLSQESL